MKTSHGPLQTPTFLPDATRGVVRALDSSGLVAAGVTGLMVNSLHLSSQPGVSVVSALGGIHRFTGWDGPIASDSGGFQVYSLGAGSSQAGNISNDGFTYQLKIANTNTRKRLTPEKAIRKQVQMGADIIFCLDHCTHPSEPIDVQRQSVEHTVQWARRGKEELERLLGTNPCQGRCESVPAGRSKTVPVDAAA